MTDHHPECWRDPTHHECAVREVERSHSILDDRDDHLTTIRALLPVRYLAGRPTHSAVAERLADLLTERDNLRTVLADIAQCAERGPIDGGWSALVLAIRKAAVAALGGGLVEGLADLRAEVKRLRAIAGGKSAYNAYLLEERESAAKEIARLREALEEFEAWARGYMEPVTGMGSGLHAEKWPSLTPSAQRRMRTLALAALNPQRDGEEG